jgi:hypothetical protein
MSPVLVGIRRNDAWRLQSRGGQRAECAHAPRGRGDRPSRDFHSRGAWLANVGNVGFLQQ